MRPIPCPASAAACSRIRRAIPESRALGWTPGMTPSFEPRRACRGGSRRDRDLVLELHLIAPRHRRSARPCSRASASTSATRRRRGARSISRSDRKTSTFRPDDREYAIEDRYTLPVDVDVLSVYPHAHYLAREMKAQATLPDGRVTPLIWIRNWDFHWQDDYRYATPIHLPRGDGRHHAVHVRQFRREQAQSAGLRRRTSSTVRSRRTKWAISGCGCCRRMRRMP